MDSIKDSIQELAQHFNNRMAEFQQNLSSTIPATSPTSHLAAQFSSFRTFIMSALEGLQLQVQLLSKQQDSFEMRSRRKMLLVHGVPENKKEDLSTTAINILSKHLQLPDLCVENISRCHRLGQISQGKPRALLIKFRDLTVKNRIWYSKSNLKSSGVTLSEFLTRTRHDTFVEARQRFGISRCWTSNGSVIVIGPEGKRHRIISLDELNNISDAPESRGPPAAASCAGNSAEFKSRQTQVTRTKRTLKK